MSRVIRITSFFLILLTCVACQAVTPSKGSAPQLIINGVVSLPLPSDFTEVWPSESLIIVKQAAVAIGYRWIDKEEIEFIGSEKEPYRFFTSAFNDPVDKIEHLFLEGLRTTGERTDSVNNGLEFYHFRLGNREKVYILAESLDFAIEITSSNFSASYIQEVIKSAYIRERS